MRSRALISMMARSERSNQRPDTLMQDRSPPASRIFLRRTAGPYIRVTLRALHKDKCLTLVDRSGNSLPAWKAEAIFRNCDASVGRDVVVRITEAGIKRASY